MSDDLAEPLPAPRTICLIDDHDVVRDQLAEVLERAGHRVLAAEATAAAGLVAVLQHRPEVAVIDNRLPDGSGIELCRILSGRLPDVRLILHTGVIEHRTELDALEAGAAAVIVKSIRNAELLAAVATV